MPGQNLLPAWRDRVRGRAAPGRERGYCVHV